MFQTLALPSFGSQVAFISAEGVLFSRIRWGEAGGLGIGIGILDGSILGWGDGLKVLKVEYLGDCVNDIIEGFSWFMVIDFSCESKRSRGWRRTRLAWRAKRAAYWLCSYLCLLMSTCGQVVLYCDKCLFYPSWILCWNLILFQMNRKP